MIKLTFALVLTGAAAVSVFAGLSGSVGPAVAQKKDPSYTCMGFVTWTSTPVTPSGQVQTGINPYPQKQVSGATITAAASACHGLTNQTNFIPDQGWLPNAVCESTPGHPDKFGRTFNGDSRRMAVCAIDRFKEISQTPQRYNRVNRYTVSCKGGAVVSVTQHPGLVNNVLP